MALPVGLRLALVGLVLFLSSNVIAADFPYQDSSLSA